MWYILSEEEMKEFGDRIGDGVDMKCLNKVPDRVSKIIEMEIYNRRCQLVDLYSTIRKDLTNLKVCIPQPPEDNNDCKVELFNVELEWNEVFLEYNQKAREVNLLRSILWRI